MFILKILLTALLVILGLVTGIILLVILMPVRAEVSFIGGKLKYKLKLSAVPVTSSEGGGLLGWWKKRKKKPKKPKKPKLIKDKKKKKDKHSDKNDDVPLLDDIVGNDDDIDISDEDFDDDDDITIEDAPEKKSKKHRKPIQKGEEYEFVFESPDDEEEEDKPKGKTLGEKVEMVLDLWEHAGRPLGKILKGFHFKDVYIDFITANEDAYKCAMLYGKVSAIVYNLLGWMSAVFTVRLKTVDINAGFSLNKSRWDAAFRMSFRAYHVVIAGLWFLITYSFKVFLPNKIKSWKAKRKKA